MGQPDDATRVVMADPGGKEFCALAARPPGGGLTGGPVVSPLPGRAAISRSRPIAPGLPTYYGGVLAPGGWASKLPGPR
jgi:hypothetical protein